MSNSNQFDSKRFQLNSISTRFNSIEFQFSSIESKTKFNINSDQFMSMPKQFHSNKPIQFQINSIHSDAISISIHNISNQHITAIQCQFNPIQFNFVSIQFNFMKIDFLRLGRAPPYGKPKIAISQKDL